VVDAAEALFKTRPRRTAITRKVNLRLTVQQLAEAAVLKLTGSAALSGRFVLEEMATPRRNLLAVVQAQVRTAPMRLRVVPALEGWAFLRPSPVQVSSTVVVAVAAVMHLVQVDRVVVAPVARRRESSEPPERTVWAVVVAVDPARLVEPVATES
jgi:hypothetical protein